MSKWTGEDPCREPQRDRTGESHCTVMHDGHICQHCRVSNPRWPGLCTRCAEKFHPEIQRWRDIAWISVFVIVFAVLYLIGKHNGYIQ